MDEHQITLETANQVLTSIKDDNVNHISLLIATGLIRANSKINGNPLFAHAVRWGSFRVMEALEANGALVMGGVQEIEIQPLHTFVVKNGTLWAWGENNEGQLGDGTTTERDEPVQILTNVRTLIPEEEFAFAICEDGTLWAWGENNEGQLGDGTTTNRNSPVQILTNVRSVTYGESHFLAICEDGTLWAWGNNTYGQLGDGTTTNRNSPVQIPLTNVRSVDAGNSHSLAICEDDTLWAWGNNEYGQLGDGTTTSRATPTKVMEGIIKAVTSDGTSFVARNDNLLWGVNNIGIYA